MAEENILKKDLQEVLREMSKAPGGSPTQQRPVTPGGILGGPRDVGPGVVDPATGVRTRRDSAIELFRFYAYGEEKPPRPIPAPPPDTKKVTITDLGLTTSEKFKRKAIKQANKPGQTVVPTAEQKAINKAVREGTVGGMKRPIGSKPPVHLAKNLPIAIEVAAERARRRAEAEIIRDALHKAFGVPGAKSIPELETSSKVSISREEQKYLNYLQRRIQDAVEAKKAAESWREFWRTGLSQSTTEATKGADARTLEGRQVAERTRLSREKTEKSFKNLPDVQQLATPQQAKPSETAGKIIIHSGGAVGADTEWANAGKKAGAEVIAHSFQGHRVAAGTPLVHSKAELTKADNLLSTVQKEYLPHKKFTNAKEYTKDLLRRNYFQIKDSQALIAAGKIEDVPNVGRRVSGGTSWAFYMAISEGKPAYIFNQSDKKWYKGVGKQLVEIKPSTIPRYTVIAGVGSRDLDESGRRAINDYINNRVAKPAPSQGRMPVTARPPIGAIPPIMPGGGLLEMTK